MRNFEGPGRSTAYGRNGMAATSSPLATLAAVEVLKAGGNAVDAAVTASALLCITEPQMTGIGGDCFALVGFPDGRVKGLNGSGRAAFAADAAWLEAAGLQAIAPDSVHSVTVPGAIDAWDTLLEAHGTIGLAEALDPAIRLAEEGTPVTPRVAFDWAERAADLARDEGGAQHYLSGSRSPAAGEMMRYPALAATFRLIAEEGRGAFYEGPVAREIVAHLGARGGLLSREDFARHRSDWVEPVATSFAGRDILEIPPNGQGITALIALNILERFDLGKHAPESTMRRHLEIEAVKLAWVLRNRHISDPACMDVPVDTLLSAATADTLAALIREDRALEDPALAVPAPGSNTIYLTVVDRAGLAVSFINSIYWSFGSAIVTPETGIALQNRGAGFVTTPGHPNCIGPGKRPLHTIIPAMVREDGRIAMSFGVMGGAYQPMGHVAVLLNRYIYGMDVQQAIDWPRAFADAGAITSESRVPGAVLAGLQSLGHRLNPVHEPLGGGQAIAIDPDTRVLSGGSDPRKDGIALGY